MKNRKPFVLTAILLIAFLTGCTSGVENDVDNSTANASVPTAETMTPSPTETSTEPSVEPETSPAVSGAVSALETLSVKGRAPKTGYSRDQFGPAWSDVDHNGCDTRNDILARDMTNITYKSGTHDCVVLSGVLIDPYSAKQINFQQGEKTSSSVQIDHLIPLSLAWQTGAQDLDVNVREQFANDPLNLLAVDGPLNGQKSDGDAATWLPPNKAIRCDYVARQIAVRSKYALWVTQPEKDAMMNILSSCPDQKLPEDSTPIVTDATSEGDVVDLPTPVAPEANTAGSDPRFGSCKEAKSAGYGPYARDIDSEYQWYRDGDNDGIACE